MQKRKNRQLSMTIEEYTKAILPIIKLCLKEKKKNPTSYRSSHIWYLYRQTFYGFGSQQFFRKSQIKVSRKAAKKYRSIPHPPGGLEEQDWTTQPKFDKGRKIFHLEHIYTGDMFRNAVEEFNRKNKLTVKNLIGLIRKEYCVAWILKKENKLLGRGDRGKSLKDALKFYEKKGIKLD